MFSIVDVKINRSSFDKEEYCIPAVVKIGVTGHRVLENEHKLIESVNNILLQLDEIFKRILKNTPHTFVIISPLAEGADRLVARSVMKRKVSGEMDTSNLEVVLPLSEEDYLNDFKTSESKDDFKALLTKAKYVLTLEKADSRKAAYEQVGRYVVDNCDVLIAIWDGKPAAGQGGTAEIIGYARKMGRYLFWINSENGNIKEEMHKEHISRSLKNIEIYNAESLSINEMDSKFKARYGTLAKKADDSGLSRVFLEPLCENLLPQSVRASLLAQKYQKLHMKAGSFIYILAVMAVATVTIQRFFLSDYPKWLWLEFLWMLLILILLRISDRGKWHRKWIDYRFLAERLRASIFLCMVGIRCKPPKAPPHLSISHRPDDWMIKAFEWIWDQRPKLPSNRVEFEHLKKFLLVAWIDDQVSWYRKTSKRHRRMHLWFTRSGVSLFFITLVVAAIEASQLAHFLPISFDSVPEILTSMAIILPAVGAALAGIRIHHEYLRNAERYCHMGIHLSSVSERIREAKDMKTLTRLLEEANEMMLRENQDWRVVFLFQKLEAP
ncbi:MAG: hypothetical protein L6282_18385 [Candidatus Methanoperedenaceae archaeon]|nr:hypothetical protein [Candidatus Methanoperedenaceae archaeon]